LANRITITVPIDAGEASPNRRGRLRQWIRIKKAHKTAAQWAWVAAGRPRAGAYPVTVSATIRRGRVLDDDNAKASLKAALDGLFKQAVTPDDSVKYVRLGTVTQETGKAFGVKPEVEFVITWELAEGLSPQKSTGNTK
jgi:hypothetical protein